MIAIEATAEHVRDAIAWMVARDMPTFPEDVFSTSGYVVPGLAAVWLYFTNSSLATLEFLVSNPKSAKLKRRAAIDVVVERAIAEARHGGVKLLSTYAMRADVFALAERHEFKPTCELRMYSRNLERS